MGDVDDTNVADLGATSVVVDAVNETCGLAALLPGGGDAKDGRDGIAGGPLFLGVPGVFGVGAFGVGGMWGATRGVPGGASEVEGPRCAPLGATKDGRDPRAGGPALLGVPGAFGVGGGIGGAAGTFPENDLAETGTFGGAVGGAENDFAVCSGAEGGDENAGGGPFGITGGGIVCFR